MGQSGVNSHNFTQRGGHGLVFTGTYEHTIDAKQRIAIPAEVRAQLAAEAATRGEPEPLHWFATLGDGQVLCLYTERDFNRRAAELDQSQLDAEELLEYERLMFSLTRRVEVDKQGRIRLPEQLMSMTTLGSDVVLIGVKDHLEIHDRSTWNEHVKQMLSKQGMLRNPRRMMKPEQGSTG